MRYTSYLAVEGGPNGLSRITRKTARRACWIKVQQPIRAEALLVTCGPWAPNVIGEKSLSEAIRRTVDSPNYPVWSPGERDTVTAVLARAAARWPQKTFLDFQGETYTFQELDERSWRLAHGLVARGVKRGDRVGSILDTSIDAVTLWFAVNKIGAINVAVNTAYKGEFLRHQFADAGCRLLVAEADFAQRVADIEDGLPEAQHLLVRGAPLPNCARIAVAPLADAYDADATPWPDENAPTDLAMLIFTGGTTGLSKGCMISHNYACNVARQILRREERTEKDVNWTPLPLFHLNATAGSILSSLMVGATVALYPRFSLSKFWDDVERSGATVVNLIGSMIGLIAQAPDTPSSLRYYGKVRAVRGVPFTPELQRIWKERFGVRYMGSANYGQTEAARVTMSSDGEYSPPGSSGRPNEDFDVLIVDENDNEVPAGTPGEIIVRPRHPGVMFDGYWNRPADTLAVMRNLWLHTGDIGKIDKDGYFYFVDRKKDYLRRKGENISSFEMEKALMAHPDVKEIAIHSVLSDSEDEVKATIVKVDNSSMTEEEFCRWCADQLPYFAVPRFIEFRDDLPRSPVGRILKYMLRADGCTPTTWDREAAGFKLVKR